MSKQKPPTDKPHLPSYECPCYVKKKHEWRFIRDFMATAKAWVNPQQGVYDADTAMKYLPKEQAESKQNWEFRVQQTPFSGRSKQSIKGFANLLTNFEPQDLPKAIADNLDDFDRCGNSLVQFAKKADCFSLAYGIAWMGAEFHSGEIPENRLEEKRQDRKSWACLYHPLNVINWRVEFKDGVEQLTLVVVKRQSSTQEKFGAKTKELYRVFTPGLWVDYEMIAPESGSTKDWTAKEVERGEISPDEIPIIKYHDGLSANDIEPPLYSIFELELRLYRLASDYYSCLHACNRVVPVTTGRIQPGQDPSEVKPLVISSYQEIAIPQGGSFHFAEPSGSALATTMASMEAIDSQIDRESLQFVGKTAANVTATEAELSAKSTEGTLIGMARSKESAFKSLLSLMAQYYGESEGGSILVNRSLLQPKLTVEAIALLFNNSLLSRESALQQIAMIAPGVNPEEELARITAEMRTETTSAIADEDL